MIVVNSIIAIFLFSQNKSFLINYHLFGIIIDERADVIKIII